MLHVPRVRPGRGGPRQQALQQQDEAHSTSDRSHTLAEVAAAVKSCCRALRPFLSSDSSDEARRNVGGDIATLREN